MTEKIDRTKTTNTPQKVVKEVKAKTPSKLEKVAKEEKTKTSDKLKKVVEVDAKPKTVKSVKSEVSEPSLKAEKSAEIGKPKKVETVVKEKDQKKKRISKGLATHNRRVKQEKRHPGSI